MYTIEKAIVNAIVSLFPASVSEWLEVIKVVTWIVILWLTFGIAFFISIIVGTIVRAIFGN
jgi:hypothetical protein